MNKYEGYIFGKVNNLSVSDEDILKWARQDFEAGIMTPDEWGDILRKYYGEYSPMNTKDMIKYRDTDVIATEEAYKKFKDDKEKLCEKRDHYIIRGNLRTDIKTLLDACLDPTVSLDEFRDMITAHNALLEYYRDTSEKEEEASEEVTEATTEATPEKSDEQIISEEMEEEHKKETATLKDTIRMLEFILNEYETAMGTSISERCRKNLDD